MCDIVKVNRYTVPEEEKYAGLGSIKKAYSIFEAFYMATLGGGEFFGKVGDAAGEHIML